MPKEKALIKLIELILNGSLVEIKPEFDQCKGSYSYCHGPLADVCEGLDDALAELHENGYIQREVYDNIASCPSCGSGMFLLKAKCPYCGSVKFSKEVVVEHLSCGYSGLAEEFIGQGGTLVCPKCRRELKDLGVDYVRVAEVYRCNVCKDVFSAPSFSYKCLMCGYEASIQELKPKEVYRYTVVRESLEKDPMVKSILGLISTLTALEYKVKAPARVKGRSGIEYDFAMAVWKKDESAPIAVVDLVKDPMSDEKLLSFFAKSIDINAKAKILITYQRDPNLEEKGRKLGINVIDLGNENLVKKIAEIVLSFDYEKRGDLK